MGDKSHSDEVSHGNERHVIGNWRKGDPFYKIAQRLAELYLYSSVLWKIELASDEIEYLADVISKIEGMAQFLLTAYSKMWGEMT